VTVHERKYSLTPCAVPRVQTAYRRIVTDLPVPESVPLLEALERLEPSSMQGQPPLVIDRSEGWHVHDAWGNTWLDWASGVLISNVGGSHPAIVAALRAMLEQAPGSHLAIDLEAQTVTAPDGSVDRFEIDPFRKECLLAGTDDISFTLGHRDRIAAFENAYETKVRWL